MAEDTSPDIDLGSFEADFSEKEIQDSIAYKKAEPGYYLWRVTNATQQVSKADKPTAKGWMMIAEEWTALRPADRAPSMLTVRVWTLLPLIPNPLLLSKVGYEGTFDEETKQWTGRIGEILATFDPDGGQKKLVLQKFKDRMRAFQKDILPRVPDKKTVSREAFDAARADQVRVVKTFARELWKNPSMLNSTEHYADLFFEKEKVQENGQYVEKVDAEGKPVLSEFPSVRYPRNVGDAPKTKEGIYKPILDPFVSYK